MTLANRRRARRLTIVLAEPATTAGGAAAVLLRLAHDVGLPGATALHGIAGFGLDHSWCGSDGQRPAGHQGATRSVMIVVVGDHEQVDDFAAGIAPALHGGLITLDDVEQLVPGPAPAGQPARAAVNAVGPTSPAPPR